MPPPAPPPPPPKVSSVTGRTKPRHSGPSSAGEANQPPSQKAIVVRSTASASTTSTSAPPSRTSVATASSQVTRHPAGNRSVATDVKIPSAAKSPVPPATAAATSRSNCTTACISVQQHPAPRAALEHVAIQHLLRCSAILGAAALKAAGDALQGAEPEASSASRSAMKCGRRSLQRRVGDTIAFLDLVRPVGGDAWEIPKSHGLQTHRALRSRKRRLARRAAAPLVALARNLGASALDLAAALQSRYGKSLAGRGGDGSTEGAMKARQRARHRVVSERHVRRAICSSCGSPKLKNTVTTRTHDSGSSQSGPRTSTSSSAQRRIRRKRLARAQPKSIVRRTSLSRDGASSSVKRDRARRHCCSPWCVRRVVANADHHRKGTIDAIVPTLALRDASARRRERTHDYPR
jgi:hypothetical protein